MYRPVLVLEGIALTFLGTYEQESWLPSEQGGKETTIEVLVGAALPKAVLFLHHRRGTN